MGFRGLDRPDEYDIEMQLPPKISVVLTACSLLIVFMSPVILGAGSSVAFLPSHIKAEDGKVSLFADYGSLRSDGSVPVYLINKSPEDLILDAQDGRIYLKLQYQDAAGNWVRAQPHTYSWCGNSYMAWRRVPSGDYLLVSGYQPSQGVASTIRYHLYAPEEGFLQYGQGVEISSNPGNGVVAEADIRDASVDVMSIHEGSFEHVSQVALSEVPVESDFVLIGERDLRPIAILELASKRFDPDESRKILLRVREQSPEMAEQVGRAIYRLERRGAENRVDPD